MMLPILQYEAQDLFEVDGQAMRDPNTHRSIR